ncbi:uncharacterized protein [Aegilops tauschii subsp. strangulata]|uniref:uncharacterized protein n=1 Tax=Aegilops tauschii subsp. strangulata TaxID=200361 RepID=UPI00098AEA83|nr:ethylene-responsive transcription factor ERF084-like [Aegilops tauschii subsp. strangulata]
MPPCRRGASGVRVRPSGNYSAEIQSGGGMRLRLGTFDTAQEGARACDAAAWRLVRSRQDMNFADVATRERAQELAPFPWLLTDEDRRKHRRRERRLRLAEMDEQAMALWSYRFLQDIINEEQKKQMKYSALAGVARAHFNLRRPLEPAHRCVQKLANPALYSDF